MRSQQQTNDERLLADLPTWVRIAGIDPPAGMILNATRFAESSMLSFATAPQSEMEDETQIDLLLARSPDAGMLAPPPHASYAAFSPGQRTACIEWLRESERIAPVAFQNLALSHLEVGLFAQSDTDKALKQLVLLHENAGWRDAPGLERALLLHFWMRQSGVELTDWLNRTSLRSENWGMALGWQALLGVPLQVGELSAVARAWGLTAADERDITHIHLQSLRENLAADPLAYALAELGPAAHEPILWRGAHRMVRLLLPQPDLRPTLEPLLRDMLTVRDVNPPPVPSHSQPESESTASSRVEDEGWHVILEFGQSRSEYFEFALTLAQRINTFSQLVDENRNVVYRVMFQKDKLRDFWRLWNYVEKWSGTRVYVRGEEIEKRNVWRYSQYLR